MLFDDKQRVKTQFITPMKQPVGHCQAKWHWTAEPARSIRWQIFLTVVNFRLSCGYFATIAYAPNTCSSNVCIQSLLWPPCVADADIIFLLWFLSSFFPRLILDVADWISTILPHDVALVRI